MRSSRAVFPRQIKDLGLLATLHQNGFYQNREVFLSRRFGSFVVNFHFYLKHTEVSPSNWRLSEFGGFQLEIVRTSFEGSEEVEKPHLDKRKLEKQGSCLSENEKMEERFAKFLLGEDMSGCGNGVCTALAISNAITNLCATLLRQIWRLEHSQMEKDTM